MIGCKRYAPAALTRERAQYPLLSSELVRLVVNRYELLANTGSCVLISGSQLLGNFRSFGLVIKRNLLCAGSQQRPFRRTLLPPSSTF